MSVDLYLGDCLEIMKNGPDKSIDMILCDLPYGTTACKWDTIISFEPLWKEYERLIKDNGAIVLFGSEPFSSLLRISNLKIFKYDFVWLKDKPSGYLNAKKMPMLSHEMIHVFYKKLPTYNPQKWYSKPMNTVYFGGGNKDGTSTEAYGTHGIHKKEVLNSNERMPISYLKMNTVNGQAKDKVDHPTQKPVVLLEYLIKTYTNEGEVVLDNTMGSGSTGVACINTNRNFIGIEKEEKYFNIAKERIEKAQKEKV